LTSRRQLDDVAATSARYVRLSVVGVSGDHEVDEHPGVRPLPATAHGSSHDVRPRHFARTVSNGLGTAAAGGARQVGGAASGSSANGPVGRMRFAVPGAGHGAVLAHPDHIQGAPGVDGLQIPDRHPVACPSAVAFATNSGTARPSACGRAIASTVTARATVTWSIPHSSAVQPT
jgi:hypothetical protein